MLFSRTHGALCAVFLFLPCLANAETGDDLPVVVVSATRYERPLEDAPAPIEVVSKKTLDARGIRSFDEAVNTATGVFVRPGRGGANVQQSIMLHGVPDEKRSLILLDGQQLNDPYAGSLNLAGLPVAMLDRVEVSQGPASALYGGNAMGGVVQYVTRIPKAPEATLRLSYGDAFHNGKAPASARSFELTTGDRLTNGLSILFGITGQMSNGYASEQLVTTKVPTAGINGAQPTVDTSGTKAYLLGDKGDNRLNNHSVALRTVLPLGGGGRLSGGFIRQKYDYDVDVPHSFLTNAAGAAVYTYGTLYPGSFNASYGAYQRDLWQLALDLPVSEGTFALGLTYSDSPVNWNVLPDTTVASSLNGGPARITFGRASSIGLDGRWTINRGNHTLTLGGEYKRDVANNEEFNLANLKDVGSLKGALSAARGRTEIIALFVQDEWRIGDATSVWSGVRLDEWRTFDGYSWNSQLSAPYNVATAHARRKAGALSPKFTIVHRYTPDLAVRASVGRAFRPPNVYELFRSFKTSASASTYLNNPSLTPETVTSADLGVESRPWPGAKLTLNAFHNRFQDLIYTASTLVDSSYARVNAGLAHSQGVQIRLDQTFTHGLKAFINITEQSSIIESNNARPTSVGNRMTWMPRRLTNAGIEATRGAWSLNGTIRHASKQFSNDANSDTATNVYGAYDAYTVADARIAHRWAGGTELGLAVTNLTDRTYYSNYLAPGRAWSLDLTLPF